MGLAIAVVVALITLISTGIFLSHQWWLPHAISTIAPAIDRQFTLTFVITGIIFITAQLALAYAVWKFRDRGDAQIARREGSGERRLGRGRGHVRVGRGADHVVGEQHYGRDNDYGENWPEHAKCVSRTR